MIKTNLVLCSVYVLPTARVKKKNKPKGFGHSKGGAPRNTNVLSDFQHRKKCREVTEILSG